MCWLNLLRTAFILHINALFRNIINIADENGTKHANLPKGRIGCGA